jgi:hypothetical protein
MRGFTWTHIPQLTNGILEAPLRSTLCVLVGHGRYDVKDT